MPPKGKGAGDLVRARGKAALIKGRWLADTYASGLGECARRLRSGQAVSEDPIIRPLERCDLPAALTIQSEVYPDFLVEPADAFASRLDVSPQFCLAAVSDGELVGYLLAHGWPRQSPPPVGAILSPSARSEVLFIHDLAVGAKGRGLAVGRRLVNHAFELAAHQKLARAELIAVEGAAAYWRSLGFAAAEVPAELEAKVAVYGSQACWMARIIPSPAIA